MTHSNLKALILLEKFQKNHLNTAKSELAQYLADENSIERDIQELDEKIHKNQTIMTENEAINNLTMLNGYRHWLAITKEKRDHAELKLADMRERTEQGRLKVLEAAKDLNATQSLIKALKERIAHEKALFEQCELDEKAQFSKLRKPIFHNYNS